MERGLTRVKANEDRLQGEVEVQLQCRGRMGGGRRGWSFMQPIEVKSLKVQVKESKHLSGIGTSRGGANACTGPRRLGWQPRGLEKKQNERLREVVSTTGDASGLGWG